MARAVGDGMAASEAAQRGTRVPRRDLGVAVVAVVVVLAALGRPLLEHLFDRPAFAHWATIFVSIAVQAMPFLVLGIAISGAIAAFVPQGFLPSHLPQRPALAVPTAAVAGAALPGCECGSVPVAARLVSSGVAPAAALTFLLSSPAINPVVLVATAVAFPGQPEMVAARLVASVLAAVAVGFAWTRLGNAGLVARARRRHVHEGRPVAVFFDTAQHDLLQAGGFLMVGAATAATLQTVVPRTILDSLADTGLLSVLALAGLAVILAICSEADAFVAASLTQFSMTSRLAFMVVGPMVDVKLIALQTGTFGKAFAVRFAPLTFVAAVASSLLVGWWLL
ncbi:MAG: permease [Gaiellaceae bacterium]